VTDDSVTDDIQTDGQRDKVQFVDIQRRIGWNRWIQDVFIFIFIRHKVAIKRKIMINNTKVCVNHTIQQRRLRYLCDVKRMNNSR